MAIKKTIPFILFGNGGVHAFYYLRLILSSSGVAKDYPFLELDMPYIWKKNCWMSLGEKSRSSICGLRFR